MRPDQRSEHDEDKDKTEIETETEAGAARPLAGFDLPIYDPEDVQADDFEDDDEEEDDDDGDGLEDELLSREIEEEPRTVLITGACGNLGRKLRSAWTDIYDLVLIDNDKDPEEDDAEIIDADLSILGDDWITHFHGVDTVVHLAANPDDGADWEDLIGPNLDVMANVFHAAALAGVERVIYASSHHVMGGYRLVGDGPITAEMEPFPDGPYGVTKLVGERMGRSLARAFDLTFIGLRLGWVQPGKNRAATLPDDWCRRLWLSNADLIRLFDAAVETEIEDRSFVVVNGMSRNHGMRWDLSDTAELLGFLPVNDAFATVQPVERPERALSMKRGEGPGLSESDSDEGPDDSTVPFQPAD